MNATDSRLIRLSDGDNVLVVRQRIPAGETITLNTVAVVVEAALPLGHKIAARAIAAGEKILKYGAPIGVATVDIAAGAHVHVHNIRSDYTPTHHLAEERARHGEAP